jgi:acyl-CoA thioesterase YciA
MAASSRSRRDPAIRVTMLPRDTNARGTIFDGVILGHLDLAGFLEARKHGSHRFVTVAMKEVSFVAPVYVGDTVSFFTRCRYRSRTTGRPRVRRGGIAFHRALRALPAAG